MKQRGIIRELDTLGRICLPIEYSKIYTFKVGKNVYFEKNGKGLVITFKEDSFGRNLDKLGRIQLPAAYRHSLTANEVEMICYEDGIYVGPVGSTRE